LEGDMTLPADGIPRMNVLIVEDNQCLRQTLAEILSYMFPDISLFEAATGEEALEVVRRERPEVIFMDIQLPGDNGLVLTRKIKAGDPDIVIVIHTNYDLPEYREAAEDAGADHFLPKQKTTMEDIGNLMGLYIAAS
jgi:CheY-like chemotaxis protein